MLDPWKKTINDGVVTLELESWIAFYTAIHRLHNFTQYVYRGQQEVGWPLWSSLDRLAAETKQPNLDRDRHLQSFKDSALGRRGPHPRDLSPDEWWALGQHYGLKTPLLDWTRAPFVAAFFAFERERVSVPGGYRVVYALSETLVTDKCAELEEAYQAQLLEDGPDVLAPDTVRFIRPNLDENARLLSQGGLFTRMADNDHMESWVVDNFPGQSDNVLIKILIPNEQRDICLKDLNRMNINHLTLFPDLTGSSEYANLKARLAFY